MTDLPRRGQEWSEAEEQAYWEIDHPEWSGRFETRIVSHDTAEQLSGLEAYAPGADSVRDVYPEPSAAAIANAQPEWVPESTMRPSEALLLFQRKIYGDKVLGAGFSMLECLRRSKVWRTQAGVELTPEQMTVSHAQNTKLWLERRAYIVLIAAQTEAMCYVADHDGGEQAHYSLEDEDARLHEIDAIDFLRELPLYKAIAARAAEALPVRGAFA